MCFMFQVLIGPKVSLEEHRPGREKLSLIVFLAEQGVVVVKTCKQMPM